MKSLVCFSCPGSLGECLEDFKYESNVTGKIYIFRKINLAVVCSKL